MKKKTKKILGWTLIPLASIILLLVLVLAFAPLIVQTYINSDSGTQKVNELASKYLDAQIEFKKINLKIWKNMPNIELELRNAEIISQALTSDLSDTLLKLDTLSISVNTIEFLKNRNIIVNDFRLINPSLNGRIDKSGKANWEIYESDTTPDEDTSSFEINNIIINNLEIRNISANYIDETSMMEANIDTADIFLFGNIEKNIYKATASLRLHEANYKDENTIIRATIDTTGINLNGYLDDNLYTTSTFIKLTMTEYCDSSMTIKDIPLSLKLDAETNSDFNRFKVDTLNLTSNDIHINAFGVAEDKDSSWLTDLSVNLNIAKIENVIKMIPENFTKDLKDFRFSGAINLDSKIRGTFNDSIYPNVDANISLDNVKALHIGQNDEIKLNMNGNLSYNSENIEESYINISKFEASVGETFIDLTGNAKNIINPYIDAKLKCNVNLDYISKLIPIEDIEYRGKLSSDIEAKFALDKLMKADIPSIYMLGNINIKRIFVRIPSQRFMIFGRNATADLGINSIKSRRSNKTHMTSAMIGLDTLHITAPKLIDASVSKLNLSANIDDAINDVPVMRVSGRLTGLQAIMYDTLFVSGKTGRLSLSVRPDSLDALIPALKGTLRLDSVTYYEPKAGIFLDSTRMVINGMPRIRKYKRVNGERVLIDQSQRKPIDLDSLISLCHGIDGLETALKKFTFNGDIYMKVLRYTSPYLPIKTVARRADISFTDDTLYLDNFMLRMGKSRLKLNGEVTNMRRAFLRGKVLGANINIASKNLDLNEILYAYYQGEQEREKDNAIRSALSKKEMPTNHPQIQAPQMKDHSGVHDSVKAHVVDSLRRKYTKKELSEIYNERMGRMNAMIQKAYDEELANGDNDDDSSEDIDYDTVPMTLISVPENLACDVKLKLDTIKFSGLKMNNFNGGLAIKNSTLQINDLQTQSNVGDLKLNAMYHCNSTDIAHAGIDLVGTNITVEDLLSAVPIIDSIFPMLSSFEGKLDCDFSAVTDLNKEMEPILPSMKAACYLNGKDLVLLDGETFTEIAKLLLFKKKTKNIIDKMSVEFTIDNSTLDILPFALSMDKYKVAVSGNMNFDFQYDYHISVLKSPIIFDFGIDVTDDGSGFKFKLVKPKYKDEKSIAQSINLTNQSGKGRVSMQQMLRKIILEAIENYGKKEE